MRHRSEEDDADPPGLYGESHVVQGVGLSVGSGRCRYQAANMAAGGVRFGSPDKASSTRKPALRAFFLFSRTCDSVGVENVKPLIGDLSPQELLSRRLIAGGTYEKGLSSLAGGLVAVCRAQSAANLDHAMVPKYEYGF